MDYTISFQERVKLGMEQLSKQSPVTLSMAHTQIQKLKNSKQIREQKTKKLEISLFKNHFSHFIENSTLFENWYLRFKYYWYYPTFSKSAKQH